MSNIETSRHIPLDGNYNVRDIGGYPTNTGGTTRWKIFLRSDSMGSLTTSDQDTLIAYGIKSVIDLRTTLETQTDPNVFYDSRKATYRHFNIVGDVPTVPEDEWVKIGVPASRIVTMYTRWLDRRQPQIAETLGTLADTINQPAIYHCAGGKDRTGVISALLLGLAGVPRDTIVSDYSLTAKYLFRRTLDGRDRSDNVVLEAEKDINSPKDFEDEFCPPGGMEGTLDHLDKVYGGIEAYTRVIGLTENQIGSIRDALTT